MWMTPRTSERRGREIVSEEVGEEERRGAREDAWTGATTPQRTCENVVCRGGGGGEGAGVRGAGCVNDAAATHSEAYGGVWGGGGGMKDMC